MVVEDGQSAARSARPRTLTDWRFQQGKPIALVERWNATNSTGGEIDR